MYTDSHCHINSEDFAADREGVVARARAAEVKYILDVCDDIAELSNIIAFCKSHENIYTTVGVHPEIADKYPDLEAETLLAYTKSPYVVGIGECGLDYFYNSDIKDAQIKVFKEHIKASQISGLPLIIHNRDADDDMMEILESFYKIKPFTGELHCFSSSEKLAQFALDLGFYISASGIITFKKSQELRDIFTKIPQDKILIETDSPFLAPEPHRGKRNEPAFVVHTAERMAKELSISAEEFAKMTTENFLQLFSRVNKNG